LAGWMANVEREIRNTEFYRGLIVQIGEMFGTAAKTSDDGTVQEDVLALKIPELVQNLLATKVYEITNDSLVMIRQPAAMGDVALGDLDRWCVERNVYPLLVLINDDSTLDVLNEAEMNAAGWFRRDNEKRRDID